MTENKLSELDCRILARACGLCWHRFGGYSHAGVALCSHCGKYYQYNPTFDSPNDWELVREKVVHKYLTEYMGYLNVRVSVADPPEILCEAVCNWIKTRPDLFPWVVEFAAEIAKEIIKSEPNPTQIASGKRMPWEDGK